MPVEFSALSADRKGKAASEQMSTRQSFGSPLAVNTRAAGLSMGGQQRVTTEILQRLGPVESIAPSRSLAGIKGHAWEQFVLPWRARGKFLWSPSATGPLAVRRQILTLHDVAFLDIPEFFAPKFVRFYSTLMPRLVRRVAKVVTVSEFSRRRIAATLGIDADQIEVISNGVCDQFHLYEPEDIAAVRAALDLPQRYLVLQATSDRRKNLPKVLQAWNDLQGELPEDLWLVVAGNLAREHVFGSLGNLSAGPRTRILGFVDEQYFAPLIAAAEGFLFPSLYEGFGIPILEAMSCGTPVLTSAATATQEIAGDAALLVDPASLRSIAEGIRELAADADLRARLKSAGLKHARKFTWDDAAQRYRQLFAEFGVHIAPP